MASSKMRLTAGLIAMMSASPAVGQVVPTVDTEDATLGSSDVGNGRIHPVISIDLRNGDFARGNYDDDRADLSRLPAHIEIGVGAELHHDLQGEADTWIVLQSSNGFHAPSSHERTSPRSFYESNNLIALVTTPTKGVHAAAVYTIKASPNGVADTTHEASISLAYEADHGVGLARPVFVATIRPKGDHGVYTQAGIEPSFALGSADDMPSVSIPLAVGIGWGGFYGAGSGDRMFGQAGVALSQPFTLGMTKWTARAEMVALIRDDRLRMLSGPKGETGTVVPLGTVMLTLAY